MTSPTDSPLLLRPTRVRWLIFGIACAASWLLYVHRYAWGAIRPYFRAENPELSAVELGWIDSAFLATYAIGQVPGGLAGDLLGPRATLSVFTLVWSLAAAGVAWTGGFWGLVGARASFGLAQAGAYPVISKITKVWFPLATRTTVQGAVTAMGRVGGACATLVISAGLMGVLGLSWQTSLFAVTLPGVLLAAAVWLIVRNRPSEHPWTNAAEQNLLDSPSREGEAPAEPRESGALPARQKPRPPESPPPLLQLTAGSLFSLAMMFLYVTASTFQDQFYVNLLPSYLVEEHKLSPLTMGLLTPLVLMGGAAGGIIGGILNDKLIQRTGNRRWARSGVAFTGKFVAACLVMLSMLFDDVWLIIAILVAVRVFSDWSLPTQWAAVTDMGGRAGATLFGIVNTVGILGGFAAGPIFGILRHHYDWPGVFAGVAGMCLFAAVTWLFLDCTKKVVND
ncbi:MAG: MFS transporter [Gemmataceae bacterium]|nr:MFS transporter [Gemmataceae bacterium]